MMTNHIGEARIKVPDRIARGEVIMVNSIISHPMDTGFFRTSETGGCQQSLGTRDSTGDDQAGDTHGA